MTRSLVAMIHVGAKALGLDADTRHDLQLRVTGKASLADMTPAEQQQVADELVKLGFKPGFKGSSKARRPAAKRGDVRFAHVLWGKLARGGAVDKAGAKGLNAFVRARFADSWGAAPIDIDTMTDAGRIATVIEALKAMCQRAGIDISHARGGRT